MNAYELKHKIAKTFSQIRRSAPLRVKVWNIRGIWTERWD